MQPMIAILTPFRCRVAALIRAVVVCKIEERPTAGRAGDVIGLEDPRARRLQNVVAQAKRLARGFLALHENGIADSIANQRADVRGRVKKSVQEIGIRSFALS